MTMTINETFASYASDISRDNGVTLAIARRMMRDESAQVAADLGVPEYEVLGWLEGQDEPTLAEESRRI